MPLRITGGVGFLLLVACSDPAQPEPARSGTGGTQSSTGGVAGTGSGSPSPAGGAANGSMSTGGASTGGMSTGGTSTGGTAGNGGSTLGDGSAQTGGAGGNRGGAAAGNGGAAAGNGGAAAGNGGAGGACPDTGKAVEFDGDMRTRVNATIGDTLPQRNASRTVEMWVYTVTKSWRAEHHLYQYGGTNPREGAFGIDFGDGPYPDVETYTNGTGDNHFKVPTATVKETGWFHFAMVWDGPTKTLKGVINGVTIGRKTLTVELTTPVSALSIGYSPTFSGNSGFTGKIDEFRIWNVARSDADILSTLHRRLTGKESGLVAYFPFDEGTGAVSKDLVNGFEAKFEGTTMPRWASSEVELVCQ